MLGDVSNTSSAAAAESRDACRANDDCVEERIDMPTKNTLNMYEYEGDVRVVCGDVFLVQHICGGACCPEQKSKYWSLDASFDDGRLDKQRPLFSLSAH